MPNQIQFMDCPHCGKRVRTTAERCHRCGQVPAVAIQRSRDIERATAPESGESEEHHTAILGGYRAYDDDFDYEEFLDEEFAERGHRHRPRPWWWYVAWVVLAVFVLGIVIDLLLLMFATPVMLSVPS